jgi:hypothetical protein
MGDSGRGWSALETVLLTLNRHEIMAAVSRDRPFRSAIGNACLDAADFMLATDDSPGVVEQISECVELRVDKNLGHHKAKQPPMM